MQFKTDNLKIKKAELNEKSNVWTFEINMKNEYLITFK